MSLDALTDRLEKLDRLDGSVGALRKAVAVLPAGPVKDTLHGVRFGHPLHPALAQGALGAFLSAALLDATKHEAAARLLVGAGLIASAPAAVAGAVDWAEQHEQQMRVGLVHAVGNVLGLTCYGASLIARARGRTGLGRALGYAGFAALSGSGFLGGHLAFRQAAGANHAEHVPHLIPAGWHDLGPLAEIPQRQLIKRRIGDVPVLVHRHGQAVDVLADACPHLGAPLSDGQVKDACVVCPWHGSEFRLADGGVARGPATAPAPRFETRTRTGILQARLPGAG
jgi:nitrite reductase/ring-hydroxylating ferredoxin subunit